MRRYSSALAVLALATLAVGCSTPIKLDEKSDVPIESRALTPNAGAGNAGAAQGAAQSQVATVVVDKGVAASAARIVYFDFDSFVVKDEYRTLIEAHAKRMASNKSLRGSIEGHTDERGGREYNLALGERRSNAVREYLAGRGVAGTRLQAVSYGEERPKHDNTREETRRLNRRAALTIRLQ